MSIACIIISNDTPCTQNYVPISYEQVSYRKRKKEKKKKKKNRKKGKENMAKVIAFDFLPSGVFDVFPRRSVIDYRGITMIGCIILIKLRTCPFKTSLPVSNL